MSPSREPPALPNEALMVAESQWIFSESELLRTPSILDGLSPEKERENRGKGVNFIFQVGIMLKLPQVTLATASVLLHRFFVRHSMVEAHGRPGFHYYSMAATSIFLATKIEEDCRKMKELVVACVRVAQKDPRKVVDEQDKEYWRWKDNILHNEDVLLEALCFDLTLEPPYKVLFEYLNYFGEGDNRRLRNSAWAFINDSCMTTLCLQFSSQTIAASALYAAAKHCHTDILDDENGRPWWEAIGMDLKTIKQACNFLAKVYEQVQVKNGRDVSIHERTPEDGGESTAKTRAARSRSARRSSIAEGEQATTPGHPGTDGLGPSEDSRKRTLSLSGKLPGSATNGQMHARDDGQITNGGEESLLAGVEKGSRDEKRRKRDTSNEDTLGSNENLSMAIPAGSNRQDGHSADEISEEGEVEA
ncbi:MAG: hypothetical protein L6R40_008200 [Gallowayella cf. fulva]|nr:MAG: hypothetical protein L6R40_008200 [Xanthomendoza cf. fulva]